MNKLRIFIFIILKILTFKIKISFKKLKHHKIIVLDTESFRDMKNILKDEDYLKIDTRFNDIKKIYLDLSILFSIYKNEYGNIYTSYLVELIKIVNPNLIITFTDNSHKFFQISKIFKGKIRTMAIQNGSRYELNLNNHLEKFLKKNDNKLWYFDIYLSFGDYEAHQFKKFNIPYTKCIPVGSLRLSNALRFFNQENIAIRKNYYDICIISDAVLKIDEKYKIEDADKNFFKMTKNILRFCKENNLKLVICAKRNIENERDNEIKNYKKYLSEEEFAYFKENLFFPLRSENYDNYNSYLKMMESKLTIACYSTMLRENIALGKKSLSYNTIPTDNFNFISNNICTIKDVDFNEFSTRAKLLLNMTDQEYIAKLGNDRRDIISNHDANFTISLIKKYIGKINENKQYNFNY